MSLYAIENDEGLLMDDLGQFEHNRDICAFHSKRDAKDWADNKRGHVVELAEKPAPEVVSEAEAKILEGAKKDKHPCMYIAWKVQVDDEDRLMRAYVNGWTVEKPKQWNIKVPHTGAGWWYAKPDPDINHGKGCARPAFTGINNPKVRLTDAEIIKYGLQDCEKVEVRDDQ